MVKRCPFYSNPKCEVISDTCERAHVNARDFETCYVYQFAKDTMKLVEA